MVFINRLVHITLASMTFIPGLIQALATSVGNQKDLQDAIISANASPVDIVFTADITYSPPFSGTTGQEPQFRPLNVDGSFIYQDLSYTIDGMDFKLTRTGVSPSRGFFVGGNVTTPPLGAGIIIRNLTIENAWAQGGSSTGKGSTGGGGGGLGGGLFVAAKAIVELENVAFVGCKAQGGDSVIDSLGFPSIGGGGMVGSSSVGSGGGGGFGGDGDTGGGGAAGKASGSTGGPDFDGGTPGVSAASGQGGDSGKDGGYGGGGGFQGKGGFGGGSGAGGGFAGFGGGGGMNSPGGFGGGGGGKSLAGFGGGDGGLSGVLQGGGGAALGGAIFIQEGGQLTIKDGVTFTGSTLVPGSGANPGQAYGTDIFLMSGGTLFFDLTTTMGLGSAIMSDEQLGGGGSSGGLFKKGPGTLILSGNNSYTGVTNVEEGILSITGTIGESVVGGTYGTNCGVGTGATLQGNGTIITVSGTGSVGIKGEIRPGTSIGTLSIVGNLIEDPSATTTIEINSTPASSLLDITGTATLDGLLKVIPQNVGTYQAGTTWLILSADGGVSGTFSALEITPSLFDLTVIYNPTSVELFLAQGTTLVIPTAGLTGNTLITANYLNTLVNVPVLQPILSTLAFDLNHDELVAALNAIDPLRVASTRFGLLNTQLILSASIEEHLRVHTAGRRAGSALIARGPDAVEINGFSEETFLAYNDDIACLTPNKLRKQNRSSNRSSRCGWHLWAEGLGAWSHQGGKDTNPSFDNKNFGALLGLDYSNKRSWIFGAGVGYVRNDLTQDHSLGSSDTNFYTAVLYANYLKGCFFLDAAIFGSYSDSKEERKIVFTGFDKTATGKFQAWGLTPHLGLGVHSRLFGMMVEPFLNFDWPVLFVGEINEQGASPINMHVAKETVSMLRSQAGLSFYQRRKCDRGYYQLKESFSYINKLPFSVGQVNAFIVGQAGEFTVDTFSNSQNLFSPLVEFSFKGKGGLTLSALYLGEFGSGYTSNQVVGQVGYAF